ncbi:MAG: VCBS repeat-containing protein [Gemmatimonadetes bacterium]|nr:VCBS repeat-containing protein [Gemmatimonadota bacterium]
MTIGGLYLSSSDPMYAFATGVAKGVTIEVVWRNGERTIVPDAKPNRLYEIRQIAMPGEPREPEAAVAGTIFPWGEAPLFADRSSALGHTHVDLLFNDFVRQPLLPNRLSQFGPGVSWYDLDGDGDEDLFITSGRGGSLAYFRNDGGRLVRGNAGIGPTAFDQTTVLGMPDGRGGNVLLVGQANYEAGSLEEALSLPAVVRLDGFGGQGDGIRVTPAVPGDTSTAGALAMADIDGSGHLDLFVAGRMLPAGYPLPASSRLFQKVDGRFELDAVNSATFASLGLVSAAIFSDINGDGAPDLLLALEWGPVRVFLNRSGRFVEATDSLGLSRYVSRWNGIATGDLDGDGRLDIIATSWGRNTEYRPEAGRPLVLHYGDFDQSGTMDLVLAQYDRRLKGLAPLTTRARMLAAMPSLAPQVRTFAAYANATIDEVIGPPFRWARRLEATSFDHMVFLNRGNRFEAMPLPLAAQMAPAFAIAVADFDGDDNEDVFLSQNFFATEIESPRYDAGRGLLLLGDGQGGMAPVPGQASGITVYGEQRGAAVADYDADGRVDLVVTQNGAATRLFRNQGAKRGLRVRLLGPRGNPNGVGASLRVVYPSGRGPAREVQAGSGYWSQNGAVQVLGLREEPSGLWIRWPGGEERMIPLAPGTRDVIHRREVQPSPAP